MLAGYGFAKLPSAAATCSSPLLLGLVMVPLTALVIPTFLLMSKLGLIDTIWAVILPSLLSPFGVYLMRVYAAARSPTRCWTRPGSTAPASCGSSGGWRCR